MKLTCCDKEGQHCATFNTNTLVGPVWRVTHGHEGTDDEQKRMTDEIQAALAQAKPRDQVPQVAATSVEPKKSGCSKCQKQAELAAANRKRIKEMAARRARQGQKPS